MGIITTKHIKTLPSYEHEGNLEIWRVGATRNTFLRYGLRAGLKLASQYDVLHATTYAAAIPASIISRRRHIPVILTIHEVF